MAESSAARVPGIALLSTFKRERCDQAGGDPIHRQMPPFIWSMARVHDSRVTVAVVGHAVSESVAQRSSWAGGLGGTPAIIDSETTCVRTPHRIEQPENLLAEPLGSGEMCHHFVLDGPRGVDFQRAVVEQLAEQVLAS
jgi:hypothetical protein